MTEINISLEKLGPTYGLQEEIMKTQLDPGEVFESTWMNKKED